MFSYHTLNLLAEARRADMLREAQPQLRPVVPRRKWGSILACITRGGRRRRYDDSVSGVAADPAAGSAPSIPSSDPSS